MRNGRWQWEGGHQGDEGCRRLRSAIKETAALTACALCAVEGGEGSEYRRWRMRSSEQARGARVERVAAAAARTLRGFPCSCAFAAVTVAAWAR